MQQTPNPSLVTVRPLEPAVPAANKPVQIVVTRDHKPVEFGGPSGPEPTRYGDWERNGRCVDFYMRRPLSPHLFIYRFSYTMSLSILHRFTGLALSLGFVLLACWLTALASGEPAYLRLTSGTAAVLLRVSLALWLVAFLYHLANGVRHLFWDAGMGLERVHARRSAVMVLVSVATVSLVLLYVFWVAP